MREARAEHDWAQTAHIKCMLAELNRDKKKRRKPFRPDEFNPLKTRATATKPLPAPITALKVFLPRKK